MCVRICRHKVFRGARGGPPAQGAPGSNSSWWGCVVRGTCPSLVFFPPTQRPSDLTAPSSLPAVGLGHNQPVSLRWSLGRHSLGAVRWLWEEGLPPVLAGPRLSFPRRGLALEPVKAFPSTDSAEEPAGKAGAGLRGLQGRLG